VSTTYEEFLAKKTHLGGDHGFEPLWLPADHFPFQVALSEWEIRKGRSATFAGCGLGKTRLAITRAHNVVLKTNGRALIATPLAVAPDFVREGERVGVPVTHCRDGKVKGPGVYVTNDERMHLFDRAAFACFIKDECGGIKDFDSARSETVTEFMRPLPHRGLYGATPAPNDFIELGTAAEALGELGRMDMLGRFFATDNGTLHPHRREYRGGRWLGRQWRFKPHAETAYWRWVCSWARACRRPSDLGPQFSDAGYDLPPLDLREHPVVPRAARPGHLFDPGARTLREQQDEQRRTVAERCVKVAELVSDTGEPAVCWCHLNPEGDLLERLIPGAVQVSGRDHDDAKEEKLVAFAAGQIRVLVSKPTICGYGLNWQHCAHMTYFPSNSYEQWHQCVARLRRFGQPRRVRCDLVTTESAEKVRANLERKHARAERMFDQLVSLMTAGLRVERTPYGDTPEELPPWLC
jgi:hypothetical protein